MLEPILCGPLAWAPLLPKLRGHFAEFLNNASPAGLRILSSSTCVGLRYGPEWNNSGFSRQLLTPTSLLLFAPHHAMHSDGGFSSHPAAALAPVFSFPASAVPLCPHSSDHTGCRNLHLLSIGYASPPLLRPRLPQGRSALPWKPWIFGLEDSHLHLATHSGILSSLKSTIPYDTASSLKECSPTNVYNTFPGFGGVFQPRTFSAQDLSASELLRTL